jgi:DNA-binding NtrC family response regulator
VEVGSATLVLSRSPAPPAVASPATASTPVPVVVHDPAMQRVWAMLDTIAPTMLSVVLLGETGVGKEVIAEALVQRSTRRNAPFIRLNCGALPETLLEAELFGSEKGAYTGATHSKKGLFEAADGGTLFLDEVGDMSPGTQTKLLRALESGEVFRLGSSTPRKVDVRFLSASNRDLRQLVASGSFRPDLFFRLNGITLTLPPLRCRPTEILPLARYFLAHSALALGRRAVGLSHEAEVLLQAHPWPGNIRELRNVIQRAAILCSGGRVLPEHLLLHEETTQTPVPGSGEAREEQATLRLPAQALPAALRGTMDEFERQHLLSALEQTNGNQTRAARLLGIARRTLIKKMVRHGIERPVDRAHLAEESNGSADDVEPGD